MKQIIGARLNRRRAGPDRCQWQGFSTRFIKNS